MIIGNQADKIKKDLNLWILEIIGDISNTVSPHGVAGHVDKQIYATSLRLCQTAYNDNLRAALERLDFAKATHWQW